MAKGYMYILECADGSYYVGSTKYLEKRVLQHQNGEGANHTKKHLPVKLVYHEEFSRIDEAFYREKQVQGWSRKKKQALINGAFNKLHDLAACKNDSHHSGFDSAQPPETAEGNSGFDSAQPPETAEGSSGFDSAQPPETAEGNSGFDSAQPPETAQGSSGFDSAQPPETSRVIERSRNEPKLRFKEFEGEWEENRLESQISSIDSGWSPQCEEYPSEEDEWGVLKTTSVVWEGFNPDANKRLPSKFEPRPELQVLANDILITRAGPTSRVGVSVHVDEVREKLMISDKLIRIKVLENCSSHFLAVLLGNRNAQKQLISKSSGLAESQTNISQKILLKTKLLLPSIKEQQKIANFLTAVDTKLQQLTTKKETLAQYKKGVMQQLFPSAGSGQVPQLRFKPDNTNETVIARTQDEAISQNETEFPDWEEKTLTEVATFRRGSFPQPYGLAKWFDEEGEPFVQVYDVDENMLLKPKTKHYISEAAQKQSVFVKKGTLVLTIQGSIGRIAKTQYDSYVDRTLLIFQSYKVDIDVDYFKYIVYLLFEIEKIKAPGGTIKTITKEKLSSFVVSIPSLKEQQKIATYLSAIDKKIEAVQTQITKTQAFKKGLLQGMFV